MAAGDELEQALERAREAHRRRLDRDRPDDDATAELELGQARFAELDDEPPACPYCGLVMSDREAAEQGACNDCHASHGGHAL